MKASQFNADGTTWRPTHETNFWWFYEDPLMAVCRRCGERVIMFDQPKDVAVVAYMHDREHVRGPGEMGTELS